MKLFERMHEKLEQLHGTDLETLKAAYLEFYDGLISAPFLCLLLKEEVNAFYR